MLNIVDVPPPLFDRACANNDITGMVQAVTHLINGQVIPAAEKRLFDLAWRAHRDACSRHGRASWRNQVEKHGGRDGAIAEKLRQGFGGEAAGKASWRNLVEKHGGRDGAVLELKNREFFSKGGAKKNGFSYDDQKEVSQDLERVVEEVKSRPGFRDMTVEAKLSHVQVSCENPLL